MKLPVVFSPDYDMTLMGLEKLHPFDSAKYGKVFAALKEAGMLDGENHHEPEDIDEKGLLRIHSAAYLRSLEKSERVAGIAEVGVLEYVPNFLLQRHLLKPMRLATGGTILACQLAMSEGWAINLGGGFHHAKAAFGSGFCFYADINLAADSLWQVHPDLKIMVVDLDAHQGNGFAHTFGDESRITVFDVFNGDIFPQDSLALKHVRYAIPIRSGTSTEKYLEILKEKLPPALDESNPDLVIYNAGTDIFEKDPLGSLAVSAEGIKERDSFVFRCSRERNIPIAMLLSGGYVKESAALISRSILNLNQEGWLAAKT